MKVIAVIAVIHGRVIHGVPLSAPGEPWDESVFRAAAASKESRTGAAAD